MGARALLCWLCHRSRRVSSSFHLTTTTTTTSNIPPATSTPTRSRDKSAKRERTTSGRRWPRVPSPTPRSILRWRAGAYARWCARSRHAWIRVRRERVIGNKHGDGEYHIELKVGEKPAHASVTDGISKPLLSARSLLKSESIGASKCIGEKQRQDRDESLSENVDETVDEVSQKIAQLKT